jgi:hypothetical protein
MNYLRFSQTKKGSSAVVCEREGGANTTPFQVAHFTLRNTKNKTGKKRPQIGRSPKSKRAKRKGVGGKEFLPFCD